MLKDICRTTWSCSKCPWRHLVHARGNLIFGPVQNHLAWTKYAHGHFGQDPQGPFSVDQMSHGRFRQDKMSTNHIPYLCLL